MPWRCPDCHNFLLRNAKRCPVCGCSFSSTDFTGPLLWLVFLAALGFLAFILFQLNPQVLAKLPGS
ncbi:MAG TPA: hypothetical protein VMU88_10140 [bacterium]|nr:hypothetical protein [bacterium]